MSSLAPRSLFVSVTAWSLVVLGLLGLLLAALVGIIAALLAPLGIEQLLDGTLLYALFPPAMRWLIGNLGLVTAVLFGVSVVVLVLGIAVHRRQEWARLASIWSCGLLAALHLALIPWQWRQILALRIAFDSFVPNFVREQIEFFYWSLQIGAASTTLALAGAFAWTAWQLTRPSVRAEFQGRSTSN